MGGLFRWNVSYVLHTMLIPSSGEMLVYRLVTSIDTSNMPFAAIVFYMKFGKSVASLRYDSFFFFHFFINIFNYK